MLIRNGVKHADDFLTVFRNCDLSGTLLILVMFSVLGLLNRLDREDYFHFHHEGYFYLIKIILALRTTALLNVGGDAWRLHRPGLGHSTGEFNAVTTMSDATIQTSN